MSTNSNSHERAKARLSVSAVSAFLFLFASGACALDWSPAGDDLDNSVPAPGDGQRRAAGSPDRLSGTADVIGTFGKTPIAGRYTPGGGSARMVAPDCDIDRDGFNDIAKYGCQDAGGLRDCDDRDPRARPGQTFLEDLTDAGDWNCVNGVERQYPTGVSCGLLALGACAGVQGFQGNPRCGEDGTFIECQVTALIGCTIGTTSTRKQACK